MTTTDRETSSGRSQPGLRVLDEALRLLDVLQAEPRPTSGRTAETAGTDDVPHRGGECRYCPVCRGLAALREANPEAVARVGRAVADLVAAVGDVVIGADRPADPTGPPEPADPPEPAEPEPPQDAAAPPRLQRIAVTD